MTGIDIISSGIATGVIPVNPGDALLGILAAIAIAIGVLSFANASFHSRRRFGKAATPA